MGALERLRRLSRCLGRVWGWLSLEWAPWDTKALPVEGLPENSGETLESEAPA